MFAFIQFAAKPLRAVILGLGLLRPAFDTPSHDYDTYSYQNVFFWSIIKLSRLGLTDYF